MTGKFWQWVKLTEEADRHLDNANAALNAHCTNALAGADDRIVNRHLMRIAKREMVLCDFVEMIAESPAFRELGEGDFNSEE